jgi:hypothetical protein
LVAHEFVPNHYQGVIMTLSRTAIFTGKLAGLVAAAAIAVSVPLIASTSASADTTPPPPPPTNTTDGHGWAD